MTETQVLTIAISLVISFIAVLTGVLLNNARLGDIKDVLKAEIKATEAKTAADLAAFKTETISTLSELRVLIEKNHSELMVKLSDMDTRLTRLENERRLIG